jgi:hypothetical protein
MLGRSISLAITVLMLAFTLGCKTKYVCPAYTSAFLLDMPAYKVSKAQDSMAVAADTSLDVDVIAVLAERIWPAEAAQSNDPDSLEFPSDHVVKTQYLLIRKVNRKKKNKLIATVPMITVFPPSTDSTDGEEAIPANERPRDMSEEASPSGEEVQPVEQSEPAPAEEKPADQPKKEVKEEDTKPF